MRHVVEAIAVAVMLAGFPLASAPETALVGGLLVAGGAYAMVLPELVRPEGPAARDRLQ